MVLAQPLEVAKFAEMKARSIGPAGMSGRITAISGVNAHPEVIYVGAASGGAWKSVDGGVSWSPIFDDQAVASIGALAVNQQNPDVIWIGTGEGNPRNSENAGNGVYKSLDGGKTWIHLGLENTRNIHRILLDPQNPDVAYIGAKGPTWGETESRGVFKTTDGGKSWQRMLFTNVKSGVSDMVMDPSNPNKLLVAMWEHRRTPWSFNSGGMGSGLYLTYDGGITWKKLSKEDGLPEGDLGRIGLAIPNIRPNIVYALIESKKNALYRSEDGGLSWKMTADKNIGSRPFYFWEIYADPSNENRLYNLHVVTDVSEDGGRTFQNLIPYNDIHPDYHAMWIHPTNPDYMMIGNDGGLAISYNRGKTWRFVENLPLGQFYHINVDNQLPYNVYGGMQDNGSWRGPAYTWQEGGIRNGAWQEVAFGDGFDVSPAPNEENRVLYAMSQQGGLVRTDLATGEQKFLKPLHPDGLDLRFNWNAGFAQDPFDANTIYYGSQFLHKSTNRGDTWQVISPDLTTNNPEKQKQDKSGGLTLDQTGAENHTTILAVAPSPLQQGLIWLGTDDGNLQLTTDGGRTWNNLTKNIKGVPDATWIPQVRASTYSPAEAFVVFDNHRQNDWTPYAFHTKDFGKTWTSLVNKNQVFGFVYTLLQDPVQANLLFLGTESGLYISTDFGKNWAKWKAGYPTVPTMDLALQKREADLVIGTFGRGAYVLDDIRPLRAVAAAPSILSQAVFAFDIPDAHLSIWAEAQGTRFAGAGIYKGENRARGAIFTYSLNPEAAKTKDEKGQDKAAPSQVSLEIVTANGEVVRTLKPKAQAGVNRLIWNLRRKGVRSPATPKPTDPDAAEPSGADVLPGTYTLRIKYGPFSAEKSFKILPDPRISISEDQLNDQEALLQQVYKWQRLATEAADRLRDAQRTLNWADEQLKDRTDDAATQAKEKGKAARETLRNLMAYFVQPEGIQGISRNPKSVTARLGTALGYVTSVVGASGDTERLAVSQAEAAARKAIEEVNIFFSQTWNAYREAIETAQINMVKSYNPIETQ